MILGNERKNNEKVKESSENIMLNFLDRPKNKAYVSTIQLPQNEQKQ
jgi:hypothetical protein